MSDPQSAASQSARSRLFHLAIGVLASGVTVTAWRLARRNPAHAVQNADDATHVQALGELRAEVDRLKGMVPDEAHAMADVGWHFSNLWFAGERENWPLAQFMLNEVRSYMHWAVRIIPVRKISDGRELRLKDNRIAPPTRSLPCAHPRQSGPCVTCTRINPNRPRSDTRKWREAGGPDTWRVDPSALTGGGGGVDMAMREGERIDAKGGDWGGIQKSGGALSRKRLGAVPGGGGATGGTFGGTSGGVSR